MSMPLCKHYRVKGVEKCDECEKERAALVTPPPAAPGAEDLEVLRQIEWAGTTPWDANQRECLSCGAEGEHQSKHNEGCRLEALINRLSSPPPSPLVPAPLVWTKEKPTRAGWYWYRNMGERNIGDVYMAVWGFVAHLSGSGHPVAVKGLDGEWAGPIPPPLDPKGPGEPEGKA